MLLYLTIKQKNVIKSYHIIRGHVNIILFYLLKIKNFIVNIYP